MAVLIGCIAALARVFVSSLFVCYWYSLIVCTLSLFLAVCLAEAPKV